MVVIFSEISHVLVAIISYSYLFGVNVPFLISVALGSLFPDIDHPHSIMGRHNIFARFMKHRGFTHTIPAMIIFSALLSVLFGEFTLGFMFGYATHLITDSMTPTGIMWLYPYNKRYYSVRKRRKPSRRRV